jgi:hypothetical protein
MKALSPEATEIFNKLISLAHSNDGHVKIQNNMDFMAVCVEKLDEVKFGVHKAVNYSIAHYGKLNGDLMADPEMTFVFLPDVQKVYPSSFTNHYAGAYRECLYDDHGTWKIYKDEQEDQALFAEDWLNNIKAQQKL